MAMPDFDSFELEKLQVEQSILREAKALMESGKNIKQAAEILKQKGYRNTYGVLREMVNKGLLPDQFAQAKEVVRQLCVEQGKNIEEISKALEQQGLSYGKQWIGRWISENDWTCETPAPQVSEISMPPTQPVLPDEKLVISLLSKVSKQDLQPEQEIIPAAWSTPFTVSSNITPISLIENMLQIDVEPIVHEYFDKQNQGKILLQTGIRLLKKITPPIIMAPEGRLPIDQAINIAFTGKTHLTPLTLVSKALNISQTELANYLKESELVASALQEVTQAIDSKAEAFDTYAKYFSEVLKRAIEIEKSKKMPIDKFLKLSREIRDFIIKLNEIQLELDMTHDELFKQLRRNKLTGPYKSHLEFTDTIMDIVKQAKDRLPAKQHEFSIVSLETKILEILDRTVLLSKEQFFRMIAKAFGGWNKLSRQSIENMEIAWSNLWKEANTTDTRVGRYGKDLIYLPLEESIVGIDTLVAHPSAIELWASNFDLRGTKRQHLPSSSAEERLAQNAWCIYSVIESRGLQLGKFSREVLIETFAERYAPLIVARMRELTHIKHIIKVSPHIYEVDQQRFNKSYEAFKNFFQGKAPSQGFSLFDLMEDLPKPNDPCFCGSDKKFKKCHARML